MKPTKRELKICCVASNGHEIYFCHGFDSQNPILPAKKNKLNKLNTNVPIKLSKNKDLP